MNVPSNIATCQYCGGELYISEVDEWDDASDMPTKYGVKLVCVNENTDDARDHTDMPYIGWLPVQERVYQWIVTNGITKSMIELDIYP